MQSTRQLLKTYGTMLAKMAIGREKMQTMHIALHLR